jgi:hypothetical protein
MKSRKWFDEVALERPRSVSCTAVFARLDGRFKRDVTFVPTKDPHTQRWRCATSMGDFELLVNGPRYNPRTKRGGGGAIDLARGPYRIAFVACVKVLLGLGL